ncbi:MAG: FAD-binding oxidoreductase [Planctomycetes bacterium]|nr:FAD-binding oxidoreductase [Planctomycetota bacterium]
MRTAGPYVQPRDDEELRHLLARARAEGRRVAYRGTGNSYGDAAITSDGIVVDTSAMRSLIHWDPERGTVEAGPGFTIQDMWRLGLPEGWWPMVVSGTQFPTLGGALAMNIHGKNNFKVGPIGDHVLEFDLLTPTGTLLTCSRTQNEDVFHAAIAGFGMLGAFTRVKLRMKKIESGFLRVETIRTRTFEENFEAFEEHLPSSDYLVGWLDGMPGPGPALGRGVLHKANYVHADEDPTGGASLRLDRQELPKAIFGIPKSQLWLFMQFVMNNPGMRFLNAAKYHASRLEVRGETHLWSHVEFAFLLDYVPDWRLAYGPTGFIQYQPFIPKEHAREVMATLITMCRRAGLPPYLLVMKKHRPDPFLLTHALDGYSLAMDMRVPRNRRDEVWRLCHRMSECVLEAGGKFYPAKDAVLRPKDVQRAFGEERLGAFRALKQKLDPEGFLRTDLSKRWLGLGE